MKIAGIALDQPAKARLIRLAGFGLAGFLSAGCALEGRAPLAAGFLAACRPGKQAIAALCGGIIGALVFLPFGPALRLGGILVLICAVLSAFRDTRWFQLPFFRPAAAGAATLAVEDRKSTRLNSSH